MNRYKVIAKCDLYARPHTWTKGLDYELVEREGAFTLASNEGSINYVDKVKEQVMENFEEKMDCVTFI